MKGLKIRLPDDLHTRLLHAATTDRRSLNSTILVLLERQLDAEDHPLTEAEYWGLIERRARKQEAQP